MSLWPITITAQLLAATLLLGFQLPTRVGVARRLAVVLLVALGVATLPIVTGLVHILERDARYLEQFVVFSCALTALVIAVLYLFEANVWAALFCATTAYTMQNLTSSVEGLAQTVFPEAGVVLNMPPLGLLFSVLVAFCVYGTCYATFICKLDRSSLERMHARSMLVVFAIVAFGVIGFDLLIKSIQAEGISFVHAVLLRFAHLSVCVFMLISEYEILYVQQLRIEKTATERLLASRERQYELSRGNIEAINVKCHDIKHQIRTLGGAGVVTDQSILDDLAHEVAIYDSSINTGNEALDTILTEKSLVCEQRGITLSRIVDGASLSFVAPTDLYAFFGNALDNAIEAVSQLEDKERRTISLVVKRHGRMVTIHTENFFDGKLDFSDGLPKTTKEDQLSHGFGTKSMRLIAEKYEGSLVTTAKDGIFRLDAVIPLPA